MKNINFLLIGIVIIIAGCSNTPAVRAVASDPKAGDRLELSVDWERITRGLETGDFDCKGNCARVSIDWKETIYTISGQKFRDTNKSNLAYCITEYQNSKTSFDSIQNQVKNNEMNESQGAFLVNMHKNSLTSVNLLCAHYLGQGKADNLRISIIGD